ncbi:hypothetical protein SEA_SCOOBYDOOBYDOO_66 [Mycobacterium phage ScoobyDoobyDoo]|nr:hypothetical protein SEA_SCOOBYDOOBYDOO_66 [Mycobacterium phage ScoobyDoobyDoo]
MVSKNALDSWTPEDYQDLADVLDEVIRAGDVVRPDVFLRNTPALLREVADRVQAKRAHRQWQINTLKGHVLQVMRQMPTPSTVDVTLAETIAKSLLDEFTMEFRRPSRDPFAKKFAED